jgi:aminopeptidase YwaD
MSTTIAVPEELKTALAVLDPARMLTLTERLCAPAFAGRRVGTEGHARASAFLVEQFCQVGWTVTTQGFAVPASVPELTNLPTLEQRTPDGAWAHQLIHRTGLSEHPHSAAAPEGREGLVVALADQARHAGAWIALETIPQGEELAALAEQLAGQGAIGLLAPRYATAEGYLIKRSTAAASVALPILSVRADLLPGLIGTHIRATAPVAARQVSGRNILAQLPGTDARLAAEPLVIGAHYDAVGDDPAGGFRHPGATDNAAAVAVLLELARIFSQTSLRLLATATRFSNISLLTRSVRDLSHLGIL